MNKQFQHFSISTEKEKIDVELVYRFLNEESYWARSIPFSTVLKCLEHSICLGVYGKDGQMVGFGRMITDQATFAYLADVFVVKECRGAGIGQEMIRCFCAMADELGLRRFLLTTQDAHGLYHKFGFEPFPYPERLMSRKGIDYASTGQAADAAV